MRAKFIFVVVALLAVINLWAQPISESDAKAKALSFYGRSDYLKSAAGDVVSADLLSLACATSEYYVFNISGDRGFIVVAGDARMSESIPIYSQSGRFDSQTVPDAFRDMLSRYSKEVVRVCGNAIAVSNERALRSPMDSRSVQATTVVGPLLQDIKWGQGAPYNGLCPLVGGATPVTGCAATASVMMMKYHAFPPTGQGSYGGINYGSTTYNWSLMQPTYGSGSTAEQKNEVAKAMWHAGVSFGMNYGTNGSSSDTRSVARGLLNYFRYSNMMRVTYRLSYSEDAWQAMLRREIDLQRPILYAGRGDMGGHIFVCDGYDSDGRFHFNYGWDGSYNAFVLMKDCLFPLGNEIIIGLNPNTKAVADADQAAPSVAMVTPLMSTAYSSALGSAFNVGVRVANYNVIDYVGNLGVALCQLDGSMVGTPLKVVSVNLRGSFPKKISSDYAESNVEFTGVAIPLGTVDGSYKLRLMSQSGTAWFPALAIQEDVTRDVDVRIKDGVVSLSYPTASTGNNLELARPIEVNVANNRATVRFFVQNSDEFYECTNTNVYVLVAPNNSAMPTESRSVVVSKLLSGLTQEFSVSDIPLPSGANVTSCRIYVAYNRVKNQPQEYLTATPMGIFPYNFKTYTIPKETIISTRSFVGAANVIPTSYKMYTEDGTSSTTIWKGGILSKATSFAKNSKLVTDAILVPDENTVLEWTMSSMSANSLDFKLYVSTDGQAFENFDELVYNKEHKVGGIARYYLGRYANKSVYLAFESPNSNGEFSLLNFKLLDIKTPKDIAVEKVLLQGTALNGDKLPVRFVVKNNSAADITSVTASYTIGSAVVNQTFDTQIAFNETRELAFSTPIEVSGVAGLVTPVKIAVSIAGEDPSLLGNNSVEATYMVANFYPRKSALFYKSTKMSCPGCMVTYTAIDDYEHMYPESTAGVELWRDGRFATSNFNSFIQGSTPRFFVNGAVRESVDLAMNDGREIVQSMNPPADMWVKASFDSESSRELKVKIGASFALPVVGSYKVGAIIIENNVGDPDRQISGPAPAGDKLVKNHIPIGLIGGVDGDLIVTNPQAQEYVFEKTVTIPAEESYRYRKDNIQVIAVLYNSRGEILNSSLNSFYLKLQQTDGLTFKPVAGGADFKFIYDVKKSGSSYLSTSNYRATLLPNTTYQFTIEQDATWHGKAPKLIVNKDALYNRDKVEELIPDANGVYTIINPSKHYFVEIQKVDVPIVDVAPFTVKHGETVLRDGDVVDVNTYTLVNTDMVMKFTAEVTKNAGEFTGMRMTKIVESVMVNTSNTMCWDFCMEPDDEVATCSSIVVGEPLYPYGELILNFDGAAESGTSTICYKFETTDRSIDPLTVKVRYIYNGEPTLMDPTQRGDAFKIMTASNGSMVIFSDHSSTVKISTIDGCLVKTVQILPGSTMVEGLSRGVYLVNRQKVVII